MTNGTAPPLDGPQGLGMTIRVYTVARDGTVTSDRGTRDVGYAEAQPLLTAMGTAWPPCTCPRHRLAGVR